MLIRHLLIAGLFVGSLSLHAQQGDHKDAPGTAQIDPIPADKIPPSPVLSIPDALKAFRLQPGFRIEAVASEPLVQDPVAMAFGPEGKLWVCEMTDYMPDVDGNGEDAPTGKIVLLEDTDGDGKMDKRTEFATGLHMPRALALVRDGLLVAEPPHLWFYPITEGNKAGARIEVAKDYGNTRSPEHTANGLVWALDNWIYSADHTTRFRNTDGEWKRQPTTTRGQYGLAQDDFGRLVYNSNSDQFRIDLVPSAYLRRNPDYRGTEGLNVDPIGSQLTWPVHITPAVNRGYSKGILRPDGTLEKFTAACSPLIYRGDNFPAEYNGNAFVCEPAANLVKRNILTETNGVMTGRQAYAKAEFLASMDERFRPVNLKNGPDGALYVIDMYRGNIEHKIFVTTYLRRQIKARNLESPLHCGRIYRVVYGDGKPANELLTGLGSAQLVPKLASPKGWVRDTAQQLLVENDNEAVIPALREQALQSTNPLAQIHSLWTLDGMQQTDKATLLTALDAKSARVRTAAIQICDSMLKTAAAPALLAKLTAMASSDLDADVQRQLGFTLGESSSPEAWAGLLTVAKNSVGDHLTREAVLSSLAQKEVDFLKAILADKTWSEAKPGRSEFVAGLAQCILNERKTNHIAQALSAAADASGWQRRAILDGLSAKITTLKGKTAPRPKLVYFAAEPEGFVALNKAQDASLGERLAKLNRVITWPGQPGYVPPPVIRPLTADEQKRFDKGAKTFSETCAACHQLTGLGQAGLAPPLADSEWVLGTEKRTVRIVLQGLHGPVKVEGKEYDLEMPSFSTFTDDQIAEILTYIRREWEHGAEPVTVNTVKAIREATQNHEEAWSEAELLKVH